MLFSTSPENIRGGNRAETAVDVGVHDVGSWRMSGSGLTPGQDRSPDPEQGGRAMKTSEHCSSRAAGTSMTCTTCGSWRC